VLFRAVYLDAVRFDARLFDVVLFDAVRREAVLLGVVLSHAMVFGAVLSAVVPFDSVLLVALLFGAVSFDVMLVIFRHTFLFHLATFAITLCDEPLLALPAFLESPALVPQPAAATRRSAISAATRPALRARLVPCRVMCALLAMGPIQCYRRAWTAA
jgi:hypothetical protein